MEAVRKAARWHKKRSGVYLSAPVSTIEQAAVPGELGNTMADISDAISAYIRAKDGNRPWLMRQAFTEDARVEIVVNSNAISFPSNATGINAITEILVRRFSRENENVYTLCLSTPPNTSDTLFTCNWLVGMSLRKDGKIRVGCGRYDWSFSSSEQPRANDLKITIEVMQFISPEHLQPIMSWLSELTYPWCSARAAAQGLPRLDELGPISDFLRRSM